MYLKAGLFLKCMSSCFRSRQINWKLENSEVGQFGTRTLLFLINLRCECMSSLTQEITAFFPVFTGS